jgi:hypothetical protein
MRCTEWHYRCRSCDHRITLPGADLSFSYVTFLGISPTPEAVFLKAPTNPAYAEIHALVIENARNLGTTGMVPQANSSAPWSAASSIRTATACRSASSELLHAHDAQRPRPNSCGRRRPPGQSPSARPPTSNGTP